jgi:hypothetical protein
MVASRERTIFRPEYPDKNDLPDNKSSLPGSILEHIANAVVYAASAGTASATELFGYRHSEAGSAVYGDL